MIEAPRNKSASTWSFFNISGSAPAKARTKIFVDDKKKNGLWHPDCIAEVESDDTLTRHTGADLADAQAEFVNLAFRSPPDPDKRRAPWIPVFVVEDEQKRPFYPQDWSKFSGLWRRVSV
jgi:hypothetical protein